MKINSLCLLLAIFFLSCGSDKGSDDEVIVNDSRFGEYILSHTTGTISQKDNIIVQFSDLVTLPDDLGTDELFDISPSLDGTVVKTGPQTITFTPANGFKSGERFLFGLQLRKLIEVPDELGEFKFRIRVIEQNFDVELGAIQVPDPSNPDALEFDGLISTADYSDNEAVEKMLNIPGDVKITWQHMTATQHRFAVSGLKRGQEKKTLTVSVSGSPIGVKSSQDLQVEIPSQGVFSVMSTKVDISENPFVSVYFTDPLDSKQDLKGLVRLEGVQNLSLVIEGNALKIYISGNISGSKKLDLSEGIKNTRGKTLESDFTTYVAFEPEKPQVRLVGNGTILPSTNGLVLPFEAVNLKAVQIEIVKIYEKNLPQFFQVNSISGNSQIKRVGQKVLDKQVRLEDRAEDLSVWNRFTLDLSSLFQTEMGALYQVRIGFRPEYTNYPCDEIFAQEKAYDGEQQSWSIYDYDGFDEWGNLWDYRYPDGYNWSERDNPCHVSYYISNRFVSTSLLATNIGLIAKIGADNNMTVIATNMLNAQPIQADITVLDYQLQTLAKVKTDEKGVAKITPQHRPFLAIADLQGQKSYLKLDDNASLSLSNFDVSGTRITGNVKGFIYGERGVWRPGDHIYLSFMLEDPENRIPDNHPVVMELRDPRGNVKDKQVLTRGVEGLYAFQTKTSPDDITGNWYTTVSIGNNSFSKAVKVETVKPNRLKIDLDLGGKKITATQRSLNAKLHVKWLTGLKGSNLEATTELRLAETNTTFDGYAQYEFDDAAKSFYQDPEEVFNDYVDEEGDASIYLQLPSQPNSPGALRAIFNTKVFEPGGSFSINTKSAIYYPYESFAGINVSSAEHGYRIERDKPQQVDIVILNADGKPVDRQNVQFKLYKLDWRWWWDQADDYSTNYTSSSYATLVDSKVVNTSGGKAKVNFEVKSPNWGRYIAVVKDPVSGHSSSQVLYTSWYGDSGNSIGAASLQVNTEKEAYQVGEKINVSIRGSLEGQALVSVENGSSVLQTFWIKTEKDWTAFTLDVTPDMAPNVYLHVTLLQPHGQTVNDLPIRLYGIAPIKVMDPATRLEPIVKMADELAPGAPVEISVSEASGKAMAYTLAVVDEGLLDLTNFTTPDAWEHFYSKEAIGVKTWDIYDEVIGAYGGRLERLLAIGGGDGSMDETGKKDENRFKPVVQFMGPFYLKAGESKKHNFTMPQYIGSVRTMVVAGMNGAYGSAEKATPVIKPLMVLGTLPRVVGPGEKVSLPVNVFRYKDNLRNAKITVEATGVLNLKGSKTQSTPLNNTNETLYFDVDVANKLGAGKVIITATSGNETARHEINITSRSPNAPQTKVEVIPLEPGKTISPRGKLFGMEGSNKVSLELATIPPINLEQRLGYLIRYPHGCIEQTTSSVFPQLYLDKITELTLEQKVNIENNIKAGIEQLAKFQTSGGGLSYWPGDGDASSWGTNYAYHFLIEAQKKGYMVPNELINNIRSFQRNQSRNWTKSVDYYNSELIQAYRLFTLALAGYPEVGAMNRLRNTSGKSSESIHKLAAAYAIAGQKNAAQELMKGNGRASIREYDYDYYYYSYGSFTRDLALLLETYVYMDSKTEAYKILQELSKNLSDDRWMSTQTTAYSLLAVSKYVESTKADQGLKAKVSYANNATTWSSDKVVYRADIPASGMESLSVTNEGQSTLFATLTITGTPKPGEEPAAQSDLSITTRYVDTNGRSINPDSIGMGESFDLLVTVKNLYAYGRVTDIALTQILPSGWEIQNDRLNDQETNEYSYYDYQDIRDDRVYTYFDLSRDQQKTFKISVTAAYPGSYYLPGAQAEAMYKASISAKQQGKWVEVKK